MTRTREGAYQRRIQRLIVVLFWLAIWALFARTVHLLPGPLRLLRSLTDLLQQGATYQRLLSSWVRVLLGFFLAIGLGGILAELPEPLLPLVDLPVHILRAVPVAVMALLLIFFLPASSLSLWIPLAVVFPLVYSQGRGGRAAEPAATRDLRQLYRPGFWRRLRFYYFPQRLPYWRVALEQSFGLAVKSALAGELLTLPSHSLGEAIYEAKLYLDFDALLAWTVLILVWTAIWEHLWQSLLERLQQRLQLAFSDCWAKDGDGVLTAAMVEDPLVRLRDVSFDYGDHQIFEDVSFALRPGHRYRFWAGTGQGKTTLLRLILGLLEPQAGTIERAPGLAFAVAFQEGHFLPGLSVLNQLRAVSPYPNETLEDLLLACELQAKDWGKLPEELSGGMQRQLGLARLLAIPAQAWILDEAFTALDPDRLSRLSQEIMDRSVDKLVIYVTHDANFVSAPGDELVDLSAMS